MRLKYPLVLCFFIFCLSWIPISNAQEDVWRGWLYEDTEGRMTLINSEQDVLETFILPKPIGFELYTYPYNVAVAPTGDRVAYVLTSPDEARTLFVYHLVSKAFLLEYSLAAPQTGVYSGTSLGYNTQPEVFSADGRFLAFSYFYNENWALLVFDFDNNGSLVQSLTSDVANPPTYQGISVAPVPVFFDFNTVHIVFAPIGGDGYYTLDSFEWDYLFNTLTQTNIFRGLTYDIEPRTGEVIFPYLDIHFPDRSAEIIGIGVHQNTVQVFSPSVLDAPFPFYNDENNIINNATFMQNGERVLMSLYPVVGEGNNQVYVVVDRSGGIQGVLPHQGVWIYNAFGVRDGVVFNLNTSEAATYFPFMAGMDTSTVIFVDTVNFPVGTNTGVSLYIGDAGKYPRLAWVGNTVDSLPPNPNTWAMLTAPIANNLPVAPPATTVPSGGLYIGAQARVTTDGDGLNLRNSATVNATKLTQLATGTIASILDGPLYIDGFTWWQVNANGVIGWVAQGDATEVWLEVYTGSLPPAQPPVVNTLPPPPLPVVGQLPAPILYDPPTDRTFYFDELNVNGTTIPVVFEWETLAGAKNYFFQLEKCEEASACYYVYGNYVDFPSASFDITSYGFSVYRWRAVAYSPEGQEGVYSEWNYFIYSN